MPGKIAALEYATERTPRAVTIGSANTLVRIDGGWRADCTDVDGVSGALIAGGVGDLSGTSAVVVGAGGTARPALVALADMGVRTVTVVARDPGRASGAIECGGAVGLDIDLVAFDDARLGGICAESSVLVSTVPAEAAAPFAQQLGKARFVLDAIYNPWPTPLASVVEGGRWHGDRRPRDVAQSGLRAGRAVHGQARSARGDGSRYRLALFTVSR